MKKLTLGLLLIAASPLLNASQPGQNQQPPAQVQQLFKERAQAIDKLISQAKNVPSVQTAVAQIKSLRGQLDQVMSKYKGQGNEKQMPQEVKNIQQKNGQALKALVAQAANEPALKAIADKINSINKQIAQELKNAKSTSQTGNKPGVRYARKVQ